MSHKRTLQSRFRSDKRWRTSSFAGSKVILLGVGADDRFNGETLSVYTWLVPWLFHEMEPISTERFTARRLA
jgi:hypothetical protein